MPLYDFPSCQFSENGLRRQGFVARACRRALDGSGQF